MVIWMRRNLTKKKTISSLTFHSMIITIIVETPKGQGLKYHFDPLLGCMKLNKIMPAGMVFPFDFGYIPGTIGEDGDPLDVLILSEVSTFPGCAIDCRIVGGIQASQQERDGNKMRNDRIIAIPEISLQYAGVKTLTDLPAELLSQVENFFETYNQQAGKKFKVLKRLTPLQALRTVEQSRTSVEKDTLVQLFLPIREENGSSFPIHYYNQLSTQLKEKFGGITIYNRSPATGLWKESGAQTVQDELLVYEVLTTSIENDYWQALKTKLEKQFRQTEILVLFTKIRKL